MRTKQTTERFNALLPSWLMEKLRRYADQRGVNMTEYVKEALRDAFKKDDDERSA